MSKQFNPSPKKRLEDKSFCGLLANLWKFALCAGCVGKTGCMFSNLKIIETRLEHEAKLRDFHLKVVPGPHWSHWQHRHLHSNGPAILGEFPAIHSVPCSSNKLMVTRNIAEHHADHRPSGDSAQRSDRICCDPSGVEMRDETWGDQSEISCERLLRSRHCETLGGHPCKYTCPLTHYISIVQKVLQSDGFLGPNAESTSGHNQNFKRHHWHIFVRRSPLGRRAHRLCGTGWDRAFRGLTSSTWLSGYVSGRHPRPPSHSFRIL